MRAKVLDARQQSSARGSTKLNTVSSLKRKLPADLDDKCVSRPPSELILIYSLHSEPSPELPKRAHKADGGLRPNWTKHQASSAPKASKPAAPPRLTKPSAHVARIQAQLPPGPPSAPSATTSVLTEDLAVNPDANANANTSQATSKVPGPQQSTPDPAAKVGRSRQVCSLVKHQTECLC